MAFDRSASGVHTEPEIQLAQLMEASAQVRVSDGFEVSRVSSRSQVERASAPLPSASLDLGEVEVRPAAPRRTLTRGSLGLDVRKLQRRLIKLGHLERDVWSGGAGVFGPRTEAAVRDFQLQAGLKPTGQVDALTELALQQARRG